IVDSRRVGTIAAVALLVGFGLAAALVLAEPYRTEPVRAANAAGDAACLSCHRQKSTFEQTAHRLTSRPPTRGAIDGRFAVGQNVLQTANPYLRFRMDSTASGFYETAVSGRAPDTTSRTERFDIVTGSGRKGQSYLYWHGDELYQLPISYWRGLGWINSPGYQDGSVNFERPIVPRCLECHAASFESVPDLNLDNRYRLTSSVLGVLCETCHGSGLAHVRRETLPLRAIPRALMSSRIVSPARLSRTQRLDACALCHGGLGTLRTPAFSY